MNFEIKGNHLLLKYLTKQMQVSVRFVGHSFRDLRPNEGQVMQVLKIFRTIILHLISCMTKYGNNLQGFKLFNKMR